MSRTVVLVDAVRTPFGKAGSMYAGTRADDLMVRAMRGLLERNPKVSPDAIEDVAKNHKDIGADYTYNNQTNEFVYKDNSFSEMNGERAKSWFEL